jgi:ABC-type transport system involved in multi-copper enzyme maturation permease subunit
MNSTTIWRLVLKDWHLYRILVLLTVVGSIVAVVLVTLPGKTTTSLGVNLALAVLISVTFYLPLTSILQERSDKTITFLMSLPVSAGEYVASKFVANLSLYLLPWLTIVLGLWLTSMRADFPLAESGWVPVVLLGMVASYCVVMGFALITESGGWTVALIITLLFLFGNVFTQILPKVPIVAEVMQSIDARGPAFHVTLVVEFLLIVMVLGASFYIQSRKKDFL